MLAWAVQPNFRSTLFQRLFWCGFLTAALALCAAELLLSRDASRIWPTLFIVGLATVLLALLLAFAISRPVDQRIAAMREFAEGSLEVRDGLVGRGVMDELTALDRSLVRMAQQARALVERAKLESTRREAILTSMAEGVLAVDDQLHVTFCNVALTRLAGTRMPLSGTPLMELIRDTSLQETLSEVVRTGQPAKRYLQIPANSRSFEVQAAPLISGDKPGAIAILHDITDLERLENVRKDFVANVSHEFRTPLAAIAGYAETLLDGALEDRQNNRRFLEIIRSNATRLNSIASDLLTLSELQSGPGPQNAEQVPVADAIESALSTIASEAALRDVALEKRSLGQPTGQRIAVSAGASAGQPAGQRREV